MPPEPRFPQIQDFMDTVLLLLERQSVQRQLIAFALVVFFAWLAPFLLDRFLRALAKGRPVPAGAESSQERPAWRWRIYRWVRAVEYAFFPILGLLLSQMTIQWFDSQGWPAGLIKQLRPVFWVLLLYRIVLGVIQALLSERRAKAYNRRFLAPLFILIVAAMVGPTLIGTFGLGEVKLIQVLGATITLGNLVKAIAIFYFFIMFAWIARDMADVITSRYAHTDPGIIHAVTQIGYYTIITVGALTGLAVLGFNLSTLTIIGGGLSVGVGFGLQELVSNFISGLLLLSDQSLRVGDVITVGGKSGTVDQLRMRATVLRTLDNVEIFVPNKDLLTSTVETYTHTDRLVRRMVAVGVSYDSDPLIVRKVLVEIANRHGLILSRPAPEVYFTNFGDSALNFELNFWLDNPPAAAKVQSDLRFMIWSEFGKYGIEIPFPQRDLHIRSGPFDPVGAAEDKRGAVGPDPVERRD